MKVDPGEGSDLPPVDGPTVEFDPNASIIPFPNNLVMCPATGKDLTGATCTPGKVSIPKAACESAAQTAIRTGVLNKLDGFGTWEAAMQVTFTTAVDETTLDGHIVMYQRTNGATSNDPGTAQPVPLKLIKGTTVRFKDGACTTPATVDAVTIVPLVPLKQKSTYVVAVLAGVKTADGKDYLPSFTWALARQKDDPVTVDANGIVTSERTPLDGAGDAATCAAASPLPSTCGDANHNGVWDEIEIQGLDGLWKAHAQGLAFLDGTGHSDRSTVLLAWEVTTQTTTDQLDPTVTSSPAGQLGATALLGANTITCSNHTASPQTCPNGYDRNTAPFVLCTDPATHAGDTQCFLKIALGKAAGDTSATIYQTGSGICAQVGCAAIGDILGAGLPTTNFQAQLPNPLSGGAPIPGQWDDPIHPTAVGGTVLQVLVFIPAIAPPAGGYQTLVFGHGLTSSKNALFAFAPQLAGSPLHYASVAIDFVDHGSRAVQISNDAALGCSGTGLDPSAVPQCFQPILGADLGQTRDNIRQTVLDLQRLVLALKACGVAGCASANSTGNLSVDPDHIVYAGQSLGGIIGTTASATAANIKSAVLNVPAVSWLDILEHTTTLDIRCSLVDALIDAGVLQGAKWNGSSTSPTGLCADQAWQMQPGYQQFSAIARWVIDPADGVNFLPTLLPKKFMIQEVVNDTVVPNYATDIEGMLGGLAPMTADPYNPLTGPAAPSAAITTNPNTSKWLRYPTLPASDATTGNFGNLFTHPSLLRPQPTATGLCVGDHTTVCTLDSDCAALGNACVRPGPLGTVRLQTDAITYLILNH